MIERRRTASTPAMPLPISGAGGATAQDRSAAYWANVVAKVPQRPDKLAAAAEDFSMAHRSMRA